MSSGFGLASSILERVSQAGWSVGAHIEKGIFYGPPKINRSDIWAQEAYAGNNGISEIKSLTGQIKRSNQVNDYADNYYIMQWQYTPVGDPIQSVAVFESNPTLYYYGLNYMTPEVFPTVILHAALGAFRTDQITEKYRDMTMQVFVCALNLYMVSQNCNVSHAKNPLVKPPMHQAWLMLLGVSNLHRNDLMVFYLRMEQYWMLYRLAFASQRQAAQAYNVYK